MNEILLSACTSTFPAEISIDRLFGLLAEAGYSGVELLGEPAAYGSVPALAEALAHSGLRVTALSAAARLNTGRDLSSPAPAVQKATSEHLRRCIDFAHALDCGVVGVAVTAVGRYWRESAPELEFGYAVEQVAELADYAAEAGTSLGIELLNRYTSAFARTVEDGLELVAAVDSEAVGVILDTFHAAIEEPDVPAAIRRAGDRLLNVQIADSNRQGVGHGHLDFRPVLQALGEIGYSGPLALEAFPPGQAPFAAVPADKLPVLTDYVWEFAAHFGEWTARSADPGR